MYTFTFEDPVDGRRVEVAANAETWRDLTAAYVDFLRGCGFVIDYGDGGLAALISTAEHMMEEP